MLRKLSCLAGAGMVVCLVGRVSAQDAWQDTDLNGLWSDANNWSEGIVPPTTAGASVSIDPQAGPNLTIAAGETESPGGDSDNSSTYGSVFGPEFGGKLDINGTLNFDWVIAEVQNNPTPANRSVLNIFGGGQINGVNLGIGTEWWYQAAPYVTLNMFSNAQANVQNFWFGGHVNLYDNSTLNVTNSIIDQGLLEAVTDGTRSLNIAGGKLVMPREGTAQLLGFAARGVLLGYGIVPDTNNIVTTSGATGTTNIVDSNLSIVDNGVTTVLANDPISGPLGAIAFQPMLKPVSPPGTIQQTTLLGTYPGAAHGVVLSSADPGLNMGGSVPVYTSSNPNVFTVNSNGLVTSVGSGTGTLTATLGTFSSAEQVSVTPFSTVIPGTGLLHRYSFSETSGTTTADSVGGAQWAGTVVGTAALSGGQVVLDGNGGYVQLPAGIVSNLSAITFETWVSFAPALNTWAVLFAFGDSDTNTGVGENYAVFQPHTGGGTAQLAFGQGDPGSGAETDAAHSPTLDGSTNLQLVAVYNPDAGFFSYYTNSVLVATAPIYNALTVPAAYATFYNHASVLAKTLGGDRVNYLGRSLYATDPPLAASIDEFRIYNAPLPPSQIRADYLLGPNQLLGSNQSATLTATVVGGNLVITWPTNSAYVNLVSSGALGSGALWTPVGNGTLTIAGGNFQETIPISASAQFFGLE